MGSPSPTMAGSFQLLRHLASGGMADVFLARRDGAHDKECVVKRLRVEHRDDSDHVDMFLDEAHIAASLRHHNLPHLFEIGWTQDRLPFYAMEYLEGCDCRALVRAALSSGVPIPLDGVLSIALGAAAGLHHAHFAARREGIPLRIIHRDVSPANLIVTVDGAVKVVDFGVARANLRRTMTVSGKLKGTIAYMSPEQVLGEPLDHRSDVFSLGVVLYELSTGKRPFDRDDDRERDILNRIASGAHAPPSQIRADYPPGLEAIVERALARDRNDRFPTADAMGEAVEGLAASLSLSPSPRRLGMLVRELTSPRSRPDGAIDLSLAGATRQPTASLPARASAAPPRRRRSRALLLSAAAGATLAVTAAFWSSSGAGATGGVGTLRDLPPPPTLPSPAPVDPPPAAPRLVDVEIRSLPVDGAVVYLDGSDEPLGTTPFRWTVPAAPDPVLVRLERPGFEPRTRRIELDRSRDIEIALAARVAQPARRRRTERARPPEPRPAEPAIRDEAFLIDAEDGDPAR